jgi:hypothetical protein
MVMGAPVHGVVDHRTHQTSLGHRAFQLIDSGPDLLPRDLGETLEQVQGVQSPLVHRLLPALLRGWNW